MFKHIRRGTVAAGVVVVGGAVMFFGGMCIAAAYQSLDVEPRRYEDSNTGFRYGSLNKH